MICCSVFPIQRRSTHQRTHRPPPEDRDEALRRDRGSGIRDPPFLQTDQSHPLIQRNPDAWAQRLRSAPLESGVSATTRDKTYHEERVTAVLHHHEKAVYFVPEP